MKIWNRICGFLPKRAGGNTVLRFFELLRKMQRFSTISRKNNLVINTCAFETHLDTIIKNDGYIEDQHSYADMKYGRTSMYGCGCEIFAVYNALNSLSALNHSILPDLISYFEDDGMVLYGKFGTSPVALLDFFSRQGCETNLTVNEMEFDLFGKEYDTLILTIYNDKRDIRKEVHTINISKKDGQFTAHNVYCNGHTTDSFPSVSELTAHINGGNAKGISLIGIKKRNQKA